MLDSKLPSVVAADHRTWLTITRTTKLRAQSARFNEARELRRSVLAASDVNGGHVGGHGLPRGSGRGNHHRSTDPRCSPDFGLYPTFHRVDRASTAVQRCEQALARAPEGWLVCPVHQTLQMRIAEQRRQDEDEEFEAAQREEARRRAQEREAAEAAEAAAEAQRLQDKAALETEVEKLKEDVIAWR